MAGISEQAAHKAKAGLRAGARAKGIPAGSKRHDRYVYGGLRKIGWRPSKEAAKHALKTYRRKR
jgi:hypothetical protein